MVVTANEVKKRGVSLFKELLQKWDEVVISNRGKKEFIVIDNERYKKIREFELDMAYLDVMKDVENGDYEILTPEEHISKLKKELNIDV